MAQSFLEPFGLISMLLIWALFVGTALGVPLKTEWTEQYGTVTHPNLPTLKPNVKSGDIYSINDNLYRAKRAGSYDQMVDALDLPEHGQNEHPLWSLVESGSYLNPKQSDVMPGDYYTIGDGRLYKASNEGTLDNVRRSANLVDETANWMTLNRDQIGDKRIGDIFFPGTHDSGTSGIDENSFLVDRNALFIIAQQFEPMIITNWSKTQESSIGEQMEAGFRYFDMRIADLEDEDGSLRWWHGMAGHEIEVELQEMTDFAEQHPEEIFVLDFGHFAKPGHKDSPTLPIPDRRKDVIAEILLLYLEPFLALQSELSSNPTINEILATGKNIILEMNDAYIRSKHDGFWSSISLNPWVGETNPEDLFVERSRKQETFLQENPDQFTMVSGVHSPEAIMIIAGLLRFFGNNPLFMRILRDVAPDYAVLDPDRMSFEGMWVDLISSTRFGTNTAGMHVRPDTNYTSGASVHYRGVNDMVHHWAARPDKFKTNEIHVDDAVESSSIVQTAIQSAKGEIKREVTIAFQGNAKDGYYIWNDSNLSTTGGTDGLQCTSPVLVRYQVSSTSYTINQDWTTIGYKEEVTFVEGQFPEDAEVTLEVSGRGMSGLWMVIYVGNVQEMIEHNIDLYLRGANVEDGEGGFVYTSHDYDVFGNACDEAPADGYLELVQW